VIRVLVADDQALVRGALATMLELENDITVVAQVGTGEERRARSPRVRSGRRASGRADAR
jgi:two-component system response regulator DesR